MKLKNVDNFIFLETLRIKIICSQLCLSLEDNKAREAFNFFDKLGPGYKIIHQYHMEYRVSRKLIFGIHLSLSLSLSLSRSQESPFAVCHQVCFKG